MHYKDVYKKQVAREGYRMVYQSLNFYGSNSLIIFNIFSDPG